ncbi:VWA domain-containing protein [Gordonia sp. NB41Y]|uniref:vWA domain-containing protein n=1 Tax=Gordonia sp. NB41Y TaxID=875808 RepID=UPI0006B165ED|nr:VWA domain-containing protein [Gordonia sp. NB41Y]EMP10892.2 von Willebrand factor A [Gordonia sp. NB41Y]WLP92857.1 VWA domain-containing protein [Gordonia sp. NB41Y]
MLFSAALDVDVVAHESADEVTVLLDLAAPAAPTTERAPAAFQVVLDRSGSMSGRPLEGAQQALAGVIAQLAPSDVFGVVAFDDDAQIVVPAGPLTDKQRITDRVRAVTPGGCTDLSSGYLRGLQELRRATRSAGIRGGTVLVVSDGHINVGMRDHDAFAAVTAKAAADGIISSTLGYGDGYDESLLSVIARAGNGNHVFAADPDAAGAVIAGELDGLLAKSVQAVTLTVRYVPQVKSLAMYNDLPAHQIGDGEVMIELGDLYGEESRKLLLRLDVDAIAALGLTQLATLELRYVETGTLTEHTVTLPISVNVVPGDELGDRVPDPVVRSEKLYQEGQQAKLEASRAYEAGDLAAGAAHLARSRASIEEAVLGAPPEVAGSMADDLALIDQIASQATTLGTARMSKMSRDSYHSGNRKRGRT